MVTRARDPKAGMLDLPGGFVEPQETAEQGLLRELKEELGFQFEHHGNYICSSTNQYEYANVVYNTLDLFFHIKLDKKPGLSVGDDVAAYKWMHIDEIPQNKIAFDSIKHAITFYKQFQS